MNPSTAQARTIVDALVRFGVRDVVLCPGSRSAPLAFALAHAERCGRIRLHVRIDERSAGFLALGLAKASGLPVPVAVTSGTAVANLHPAVIEASFAGVPLMVLSADRPPLLRGVGAPQTIDQLKFFGDSVRAFADLAVATNTADQVAYWRSTIGRFAATACDPVDPGPVHLNLPFADPLVPGDEPPFDYPLDQRGPDRPWISPFAATPADVLLTDVLEGMGLSGVPERGLVVVGDIPGVGWDGRGKIAYLADACGWPIIAEPSAGMHRAATWLPSGASVAGSPHWLDQHEPELVVSVGRVGLTRAVTALLARAKHHLVIDRTSRWADPGRTASAVLIGSVPIPPPRTSNPDGTRPRDDGSPWLRQWRSAAQAASDRIDEMLEAEHMLCGLHVAREVWRTAPDDSLLFLAASWPIRQVYLTARPRPGLRVLANRGANGIDGVVSSSWGAAVAHREDIGGPTTALIGDLAFLHDSNGLIVPTREDRPPLRLVVLDNNGGGIFSQLEQAAPVFEQDFERVFGTPHGLHLVGRSRLCGVPSRGISERDELGEALAAEVPGASVVVAEVADRPSEAELMRQMQAEVAEAITGA